VSFVRQYIIFLVSTKSFDRAQIVLQEWKERLDQYEYNLFSGEILMSQRKYREAISYYEQAHFIIPNRFIPCYSLMKIYSEIGDPDETNRWASLIITMPVKIPSVQ